VGHARWTSGSKKAGSRSTACLSKTGRESDVRLRLAQTLDAIAGLPLAAFLEQINALEAFEDVAFDDESGDSLEAFVL
jgi:hypothetical protein